MKAIPLWISVSVTVVIAVPFGLWLGASSLPLWLAFIVWAEYFTLGAKPAALKTIIPAFVSGVIGATVVLVVSLVAVKLTGSAAIETTGDVGWIIGLFLAFVPVIYAMKYLPCTQGPGGLPFFNGISMGLATYFVGTYGNFAGLSLSKTSVWLPLITAVPALLGGLLGAFLGWFNVVIMTPFGKPAADAPPAAGRATSTPAASDAVGR